MTTDSLSEANMILARIVAAANKGPLEGEDGFILGYQMAVGPIHAAIPFLQKNGIVVMPDGEIRGVESCLDDAVARAKVDAGLNPDEKHPPRLSVARWPGSRRHARPFPLRWRLGEYRSRGVLHPVSPRCGGGR